MVFKTALLIATLLMASRVAAHPQIYTYVDANGTRHYTDVPDNSRYRLLVLSPDDRTASGDRYDSDAAGQGRAIRFDHRKSGALRLSGAESAAGGDRGGIGVQFARGFEARRRGADATDAGDGKRDSVSPIAMIRARIFTPARNI